VQKYNNNNNNKLLSLNFGGIMLHVTWCRFGMSVASYDMWDHFMPRDVNLECPLQVKTCGATSCHVMSIRNVCCKLRHVGPLHATWCQFGMSFASYDMWGHFMQRDVNLERSLQVTTCGATSCHVMSIWNVRCKLRHVGSLHATWCQFGMSIASYDMWGHLMPRDVY
jgi:ABC-type arginine transport system ATPase subunit